MVSHKNRLPSLQFDDWGAQQLFTTPTDDEKKSVVEKNLLPSPPPQDDQPESVHHPQVALPVQPQPAQTAPTDGLASPVPGSVPLGLDAAANKEVTAIWLQVQEKVRQLAVSEDKEVNNGLEIGDVIANLESSQEKEEKSPAAQVVKTMFGRTMGLIKTVGGIVADGASTVSEHPATERYD